MVDNIKITIHKILFFALLLSSQWIWGQSQADYRYDLDWDLSTYEENHELRFSSHAVFNDRIPMVSAFSDVMPISKSLLSYSQFEYTSTKIIDIEENLAKVLSDDFDATAEINEVRGRYYLGIYLVPIRKVNNHQAEIVTSFSVRTTTSTFPTLSLRNPQAADISVLANGDIYKISVEKTGLYKIDKTFFENELGINISSINPKKIRIFGNRGGRIPEANSAYRDDDLQELSIYIKGEEDGKFDNNDYILFYAEGADLWSFDEGINNYKFDKNIYDNLNYYFIKIDGQDGKRISQLPIISDAPQITTEYFDFLQRYEEDKTNLLSSFISTQGTGKDWYGDVFNSSIRERSYDRYFSFTGIKMDSPAQIEYAFAGRSLSPHSVTLSFGGVPITKNINSTNTLNIEAQYAIRVIGKDSVKINSSSPELKLTYPSAPSENQGWLDYIQLIFSKRLNLLESHQFQFRNKSLRTYSVAAFSSIAPTSGSDIWDVTDPFNIKSYNITGDKIVFYPENKVKEFLAFSGDGSAYKPQAVGKISNQNLHGLGDEDMIIVYHPEFAMEAERLAQHREKESGIKILLAPTDQIYNEFSSGRVDPGAIRDMARLLLSRNSNFNYLLLFGDGTFDYKGLVKDIPYENFVPVYETDESLHPISGFPSDDFYGLLGEGEGVKLVGGLDIAVGRLPARNREQAQILVDKIIHYETHPNTLGDWRLRTGYIADDEDQNRHIVDMDLIARNDETRHPEYNQQKVYIDAFKQVSTSGENRYPDANKSINDNIFKGQLTVTYLGHGGPLGWAQERILTVPDIEGWKNIDNMPVFITATCTFGAYDDPAIVSPAEHAILNPKGGAIALLTTTRPVYTNSNKDLTDATHEALFKKVNGEIQPLGQILTEAKNLYPGNSSYRENSRKFVLLGDPSMKIASPKLRVNTVKINGKDALTTRDTVSALQKVTLEGNVSQTDGTIANDFNGTLYITVYDKKNSLQTLSNDGSSKSPKFNFTLYNNTIFKGSATVSAGKWSVSFWVPKNIDYNLGKGRISYYATDDVSRDAGGVYNDLYIGGSTQNQINDDQPPTIYAYMNDESFVSGGITNSSPILLLDISDDYGINVTGNAIGQDITATLDGDNRNIFILNDFYEAKKDNYSSGIVRFPLNNLEKGSHYLTAKAWDISGNSAETRIDFIVADDRDDGITRVYNYPNPFTTHTQFQFEHNLPYTDLDIVVSIYTITGKLIKSIVETKYSTGFRVNNIAWDGKDDFGADIARGVYLYKVSVHSKELNVKAESKFEKLIKL